MASRLSDRVLQARDDVLQKNRFKNLINCNADNKITYSEKYIIVHILSSDLLSLNKNVIFWRFFITFNILNVFVRWKNCKFQSPKSSTGTSISVTSLIPRYRALSLLSKSVFKIMGNLKEKFGGQKIQAVLFWNLSFPDSAGRC